MKSAEAGEGVVLPDYKDYGLACLPNAVMGLLGLQKPSSPLANEILGQFGQPKKVVLLLVDGLGHNTWHSQAVKTSFFGRVAGGGFNRRLTSVFPSATAASVTTLSSGLTPQEHGLLDWHMYFDELDRVIITLPFTPIGSEKIDELLQAGADPRILFDNVTLYEKMAQAGIQSYVLQDQSFANSSYTKLVTKGASIIACADAKDMARKLGELLGRASGPAYFYVYYGDLDRVSHVYGPNSAEYSLALSRFSATLQEELLDRVSPKDLQDTVLLVTADHGQIAVDPDKTIYLNEYSEIVDALAVSPAGNPILPWGSAREVFLRVKDSLVEETAKKLAAIFEGKADIYRSEDLLSKGWFGHGSQHPYFLNRIGNVVILPRSNNLIWYLYPNGHKTTKCGLHGGLSPEEMYVSCAAARLSDLK